MAHLGEGRGRRRRKKKKDCKTQITSYIRPYTPVRLLFTILTIRKLSSGGSDRYTLLTTCYKSRTRNHLWPLWTSNSRKGSRLLPGLFLISNRDWNIPPDWFLVRLWRLRILDAPGLPELPNISGNVARLSLFQPVISLQWKVTGGRQKL